MKVLLTLGALTMVLASACAPRPTAQGGAMDRFAAGGGQGAGAAYTNSSDRAANPKVEADAGFRPNQEQKPAPDTLKPSEGGPGSQGPDYLIRRDRYQALSL